MRGTLIAVATVAILAGCSTYDSVTQRIAQSITPYRITVVQGNFVSKEAASQMQVGMSRDQVKALLGTPLADRHVPRGPLGLRVLFQARLDVASCSSATSSSYSRATASTSWSGGENLPSNLELLAEIDGDKGVKVAAVPPSATTGAASAAVPASGTAPGVTAPSAEQPSIQPNASAAVLGRSEPAGRAGRQSRDQCGAVADRPHAVVRASERAAATAGHCAPGVATGGNSQIQLKRPAAADQYSGQQRGRSAGRVAGACQREPGRRPVAVLLAAGTGAPSN